MRELRKLGVLSAAKVHALICAIFGLVIGVVYAVVGAVAGVTGGSGLLAGLGLLAIIVLPVLYAIFGFIGGLIVAAIYNIVARWIGGIEIDLD
ncbi:hypothetical protein COV18_05215 [Candidatus Woesearchaeota archaeon CG10_big_fil_rev_8_21_14_0_10_37_12]|nr:MAG: hypothetical protein COV18_05215 [Candidatus Woesearchaeota archaeon CG10_big_fil_rev_8_21_14_0_10_37_12]